MSVCCECCVLSGRGLCDGLITRPEESYRLWRVVVRDQETSKTRRLKNPLPGCGKYNPMGCNARKTNIQMSPTRFGTTVILRERTPVLLRHIAIKWFYSDHVYQMCGF
jgi:hypothetical protein